MTEEELREEVTRLPATEPHVVVEGCDPDGQGGFRWKEGWVSAFKAFVAKEVGLRLDGSNERSDERSENSREGVSVGH